MRLPVLIAAGLVSLALGACGGSDPKPAPGSPENPLTATRPSEPGSGQGTAAGQPGTGEPSAPATKPGYKALVDRQTSKPARRFSPCNLVTRPEARAIVGEALHEPVEAVQGPTCIYRPRAGKALITLAIQDMSFKAIRRQIADLRQVAVSDRTAYCGTYGQPMLYVPLGGDRLLSVSAECGVARGFAAKALRHL
jgi:hypothetical protein